MKAAFRRVVKVLGRVAKQGLNLSRGGPTVGRSYEERWALLLKTQTAGFIIALAGSSLILACTSKSNSSNVEEMPTGNAPIIELLRDDWGLAHIYADTEDDGYFALGYALGQDRLQPILFNYLRVQGKLAESFGSEPIPASKELRSVREVLVEDPVESDSKMLRDRYFQHAKENFPQLPPQLQANLESFIDGLELYLRENPDDRPWWAPNLHPALPLALYSSRLAAIDDGVCLSKLPTSLGSPETDVASSDHADSGALPMTASNAWVLGSSKTKANSVIFSSDSHGPVEEIGTFLYAWRMKAGEIDGFFLDLTGAMALIKGHTRYFAWAWTEGPRHVADCYRVKVDQSDPSSYYFDGERRQIESSQHVIKVANEPSREVTFEYTRHNAVLSPVVKRTDNAAYVVSSSYTGREGLAHARFYEMALARDQESYFDALSAMEIYPANLLVGGANGTVLYLRPGRIPVRPSGVDASQILDGNSSKTLWRGVHQLEDMPQILNPSEGWVGNSNVSPDKIYRHVKLREEDFAPYMGFETGFTNRRQLRLIKLLDAAKEVTFRKALEFTADVTLYGADLWSNSLREALADEQNWQPKEGDADEWGAFIAQLSNFDGTFVAESQGALYYVFWREELIRQFPNEIDRITESIYEGRLLSNADRKIIADAAVSAFGKLASECGITAGEFGDVHRVRGAGDGIDLPGVGLRMIGGVQDDFGREPIDATLWASGYQPKPNSCKRELRWGSRSPFVVEFTDPIKSYSLQAFGVSDDPESPHYADQVPLIANGELKSNYFERDQLEKTITQRLEFVEKDGGWDLNQSRNTDD